MKVLIIGFVILGCVLETTGHHWLTLWTATQ